jgi:hypothetical protein
MVPVLNPPPPLDTVANHIANYIAFHLDFPVHSTVQCSNLTRLRVRRYQKNALIHPVQGMPIYGRISDWIWGVHSGIAQTGGEEMDEKGMEGVGKVERQVTARSRGWYGRWGLSAFSLFSALFCVSS